MRQGWWRFGVFVLGLVGWACSPRPEPATSRTAAAPASPGPAVVALEGTEPGPGADLTTLAGWVGDATIVGLGENEHGSHDLHRLAHRIFGGLVEDAGFSVFALEVDQAHGMLLDEYVTGRRDDLDALLALRWWGSEAFYDEALRELLLWLRAHNREATTPLHVAGFDLKQPDLATRLLVAELTKLDPAAGAEVANRFADIESLGGLGLYPNVRGYSAALKIAMASPAAQPQRLEVAVQVRSAGSSFGTVDLWLQTPGRPLQLVSTPIGELAADKLGVGWRKLAVAIELPPGSTEATFTMIHRGDGTLWFDGVEARLGDQPFDLGATVADAVVVPLMMPGFQVMDYVGALDPEVGVGPSRALRVDCDPRVGVALRSALRITDIVEAQLSAAAAAAVPAEVAVRLRQLARLIVQATSWRTIAELNRDVFLAENLTWLAREAYPGARIVALAHTSHSERLPRRMGALLADRHADRYRTVSMYALSGAYREHRDAAILGPAATMETVTFGRESNRPLEAYLATLAPHDLIVRLAGNAVVHQGFPVGVDLELAPDVAIVVGEVGASRALALP